MKQLIGGLCCASFILAGAATLFGSNSELQGQDHKNVPVVSTDAEQSGTEETVGERAQAQKATSLEVMTTDNCKYCRRQKVVTVRLLSEGYDVVTIHSDNDTRGTTAYPTLYYLDDDGRVIRKEVGFKTRSHVVKYLGK
jgi:hypothetical protein